MSATLASLRQARTRFVMGGGARLTVSAPQHLVPALRDVFGGCNVACSLGLFQENVVHDLLGLVHQALQYRLSLVRLRLGLLEAFPDAVDDLVVAQLGLVTDHVERRARAQGLHGRQFRILFGILGVLKRHCDVM